MRLFIFFLLFSFLTSLAQAQQPKPKTPAKTDPTKKLFWYRGGGGSGGGRGKVQMQVLITPTLDTVQYIAATQTIKVKSKSGIGKKYDKMMEDLERTPQRMNEMMQALTRAMSKPVVPHYAVALKSAYERVQNDLSGALSNELQLPDSTVFSAQAVASILKKRSSTSGDFQPYGAASGPNIDDVTGDSYITDVKELKPVAEMLAYYEEHKNDVISYVPAPPRNEYTYCSPCDTAAEVRFQQEYKVFMKEFLGDDDRMMHMTWAIMRDAQLLFPEEESTEINGLIYPIMAWILDRTDKKTRLLANKYIDDPSRARTVTMVGLSVNRMQQLLGLAKEGDQFYIDVFLRGQLALSKLIEKSIREYDYSLALNIQMMFSVERQFQLLNADIPRMDLMDMLNFNQFKMNVDISAKISGDGFFQLGHIRGDNWYAAVPGKDCKLKWILMGPDKTWLKGELIAADIQGNGGQIKYAGTKDWQAPKPLLRLDFCGEERKDTAELYGFQAVNSQELWTIPKIGTRHSAYMSVVLVNCFIDVERAKEKAAYFKQSGNIDKVKQQMMQQYEQFMKNGGAEMAKKNAAQMTPQDIQKMMQLAQSMNAADKIGEIVQSPTIANYLLLPTVRNKSKVVFKETMNGKEVFPEHRGTEYAWLHVTMEQDPNSPYKGAGILNK